MLGGREGERALSFLSCRAVLSRMLERSHYLAQIQPVWDSLNKNGTRSVGMSGMRHFHFHIFCSFPSVFCLENALKKQQHIES